MEKDLNLGLRTNLLEMALHLENLINDCLKAFLEISLKEQTKTLSYKSSSIGFKTKIDLLFDLGKINKVQLVKLCLASSHLGLQFNYRFATHPALLYYQ